MTTERTVALATLLVFASQAGISAQDNRSLSDTLSIEEAVITTLKIERSREEIPASVNIVTSLEAKKMSSTTIADVLRHEPGLAKGGDGVWATNINIRGLGENRILTMVDNNRVETSTDLTASLSMIDVNDIAKVEVIKGAQSSIYGTGAMGGIVNIITKDGQFAESPYFRGNVTANYSSANNGHGEYVSLKGGGKRWYIKLNGSYGHAGDISTPEGILKNSGFTTSDIGAVAGFKPAENHILKVRFQRNRSYDVGIPGGAAFTPAATATYKDIGRTLYSLNYEIKNLTDRFESLRFKGFYQEISRDVEMIPNAPKPESGAMPTKVTPYGRHRTFGGSAEGNWKLGANNTFTAGAEFWQMNTYTDRNKYIDQYASGELIARMIRNEYPLPRSSYRSAGIYAQDEFRFADDRLTVTFGARFDLNFANNGECHNVESVYNVTTGVLNPNPPGKVVTFKAGHRTDPSWSGNVGLLFKLTEKLDLTMNGSRSYRSPFPDELFKFIDLAGNKVRLGNPDLKSEKGLGADIGARFHGEKLNFQISAFVTGVNDMIVERMANAGTESGIDTLVLDNASRAVLYGFDFNASCTLFRNFDIYAAGACTIGNEIYEGGSRGLPLIPPVNGHIGVSYKNMKILGASLELVAAGAKRAERIAEGEWATDAYCRLDLTVNSRIFSFGRCALQLFGGIDNICNTTYTNFLSTNRGNITCEPGRNFYIRANLTF